MLELLAKQRQKFVCNLFDKRAGFPFKCNMFPAIDSKIAASCKYNTFYSQLFRYFDIISDAKELSSTIQNLIDLLIAKDYKKSMLINKFQKFINKNSIKYAHKFSVNEIRRIKIDILGRNQSFPETSQSY